MKKSDAIHYFGTAAELARVLGISKSAISMWGENVPARSSYRLELMTGGKLKAAQPQAAQGCA